MPHSISKSKVIGTLLLIIVVLRSGHAFQTIFSELNYLLYIPAFIAFIILLLNSKKLKFKNQNALLLTSLLVITCTVIANSDNDLNFYINLSILILAAYCITELYKFEDVLNIYLIFMTVCTAISLVGYYLANNTDLLTHLPTVTNINDTEYKIGGIFNYISSTPERNCGMFWEPGLFATNLIIAFILEILTKKKKSIPRLILFSIGIITANSSAGYVLIFLSYALLLVQGQKKKGTLRSISSFLLVLFVIITFANLDAIIKNTVLNDNIYFQKLLSDNINDSTRNQAISHNLSLFASNPIFGAGYTTVRQNLHHVHVADTSTSTFLTSIFGLGGALYTIFIAWKILVLKNQNLSSKIILLAIAIIIINKEPHYQLLSSWIIMFYLAQETNNKNQLNCVSVI